MAFMDDFAKALPASVSFGEIRKFASENLWNANPEMAAMYALASSGVFDAEDYYKRYADVAEEQIDAITHFVKFGVKEKRSFNISASCNLTGEKLKEYLAYDKRSAEIPKVSVLIPVYNNAQYLRECFDSVVNQTLKEIEIIIINDGSTDPEAVKIMNEYAAKDKRIRLINKKNTGYGHSMNVGLDAARGEYIGIVESDDYILENMYEYYYETAKLKNLDFIKSDAMMFFGDKDNRLFEDRIICNNMNNYNILLDPFNDLSVFNIQNVIWNGIYDRKYLLKNKIYFNETPGASFQDNGFWFQTLIYTHNFMITHKQLYMLRRDNPNSSFYNKEKIYCISDEYEFIKNILNKNELLYKQFIKIFHYKKYNNYIFTLKRVDKKYRNELLKKYSLEFKEAMDNNEIDQDIFKENYKSLIKIINNEYNCDWMESPEISIVMPVYNGEQYLEDTLKSINSQSFKNFELICVDDGSTDNTYSILNKFKNKFSRIHILKQKNKGAGNARNNGFKFASGAYTIFLDADDIYDSNMLEEMLKKIKSEKADFCVCRTYKLDMNTNKKAKYENTIRKEFIPEKDPFSIHELKGNVFKTFIGWAWDKLYDTNFIKENDLHFQEISSSNDMYFTFAALLKAKKITICDKYLVTHRQNYKDSVSTTREKNPANFIIPLKAIKQIIENDKNLSKYKMYFILYAVHAYLWNITTLKGDAAIALYKRKQEFMKYFEISNFDKFSDFDKNELAKLIDL